LLAAGYDRLSIVHFVLALLLLAFWTLVPLAAGHHKQTPALRGLASGIGIALALAAMYAVYPRFFGGPLVDADPALVPLVISGNADWQSTGPISLPGTGRFLLYLGTAALSVPWALWALWKRRHCNTAPCWLFLALTLLLYASMTLWALRFSPFAEIISLIPLVDLVGWVYRRLTGRGEWWRPGGRAAAVTAIIVGPSFAGVLTMAASFANEPGSAGNACRIADIAPLLNDPAGIGGHQHVIAAGIHAGSEILYRTPHAVLA